MIRTTILAAIMVMAMSSLSGAARASDDFIAGWRDPGGLCEAEASLNYEADLRTADWQFIDRSTPTATNPFVGFRLAEALLGYRNDHCALQRAMAGLKGVTTSLKATNDALDDFTNNPTAETMAVAAQAAADSKARADDFVTRSGVD